MANTIRFIHTGDLHLGTAFKSVPRDTSEGRLLLDATYKTLEDIIDLAISEKVDFVVFAGDVYDNPREMLVARSIFTREMKRLEEFDIGAYVIYGNHDPISEHESHLPYPPNVIEFKEPKPETHIHEGKCGTCMITGQSYLTKSVQFNLAQHYPPAKPHSNSVALLHTDLGNEKTSPYAPCSIQDLKALNYTYYALGHTHNSGLIESNPTIAYCTSPQALDINESGAHGVWIVELQDGTVVSHEQRLTGRIEFATVETDITDCTTAEEVFNRALAAVSERIEASSRPLVIRLRYSGSHKLRPRDWSSESQSRLYEKLEETLSRLYGHKQSHYWLDSTVLDNTALSLDYESIIRSNDFAKMLYEIAWTDIHGLLPSDAQALINKAYDYLHDQDSESDDEFSLDKEQLRERSLDLVFSELFSEGDK